MIRDMTKFNIEPFSEEISCSLESSFRNRENDPNVVILKIQIVITEITNKYAQLRKLSRKEVKSKTKPLLTKDLLNPFVSNFLVFGIFASDFEFDILIEHYRRLDENFFVFLCLSFILFPSF